MDLEVLDEGDGDRGEVGLVTSGSGEVGLVRCGTGAGGIRVDWSTNHFVWTPLFTALEVTIKRMGNLSKISLKQSLSFIQLFRLL